MPIPLGPTIDDGLYNVFTGEIYFETVVTDSANADVGESVNSYSTANIGSIAVETEAVAVPKLGPVVSEFDMSLIMEIFGELG